MGKLLFQGGEETRGEQTAELEQRRRLMQLHFRSINKLLLVANQMKSRSSPFVLRGFRTRSKATLAVRQRPGPPPKLYSTLKGPKSSRLKLNYDPRDNRNTYLGCKREKMYNKTIGLFKNTLLRKFKH